MCKLSLTHATGAALARDTKQGPPRSEGVVPLEGEGA